MFFHKFSDFLLKSVPHNDRFLVLIFEVIFRDQPGLLFC